MARSLIVRLLLFPILAPLFVFSWMLMKIQSGPQRVKSEKKTHLASNAVVSEPFEIEVAPEFADKPELKNS